MLGKSSTTTATWAEKSKQIAHDHEVKEDTGQQGSVS